MKTVVDMESNGGTRELLGYGSVEFSALRVVEMRKNAGSEGEPSFWLMNWVDGNGIHGSRSQWKSGTIMHSMHSTLSHGDCKIPWKVEGEVELGRGRKGNTNERSLEQSPLPESLPGHKTKQTYYYYI